MTPAIRQALVIGTFAVLCSLTATFAVSAFTRSPIVVSTPAAAVAAQGSGFQPGIFTNGAGTVSVRADTAFLSAGVDAQAPTAGAAQKSVAAQAAKLIAKAKALGIPDREINTGGYNIGPVYSMDGRSITGYQASEQLQLKWHTVDSTGATLDALVQDGGATRIGVSFGLNDYSGPQAQARTLAIADARNKAQAMAKAAGIQLGSVLRVIDNTSGGGTPIDYAPSMAGKADLGSQLPVGQLDITAIVEVDFSIS